MSERIASTVRMPYRTPTFLLLMLLATAPVVDAQTFSVASDLLFYGDNTEFASRFRRGETIMGVSGRVYLDARLNDAVTLRAGLFGQGRFGAHEFLEHAEPMIALQVSKGSSRFVFGSLETIQTRHDVAGPDRETLHGLLPPIQRESLTFDRGQEMGLQWLVAAARFEQDTWINWQRLITAEHRERFDAGYRASLAVAAGTRVQGQWHVVHEGGQQFHSGAVSDSQSAALGVEWSRRLGATRITLDGHGVITENVPDREQPARTEVGGGVFTRGAIERGPWRAHLVAWRSRDTLKEEGDTNYLALRTDGSMFRKVRDYGEVGLTRHFRPAPGVHFFAAFRLHRVESNYEYSYRIVGRVRLRQQF
jgi:hypothetical protein